ncbi:reticulon-4-interacting protein 1 homolog, mitochondrial isoform X2 [Manihot esculenta]|uniref:reticulon-4-interacting protein 1 homolog, mitochondrial isoform X2 n=1 Tax=Manihot esculenta TaxID=3983 RepID=UPI001CC4DF1D|nr:reticulon-4-interacting protein 1 homolog, mitochondrial isoform X2 [Manihot esculenta]
MHFTSTLYTNTPAMQFFKLYSFKKAAVNCDCQSFQFGFVRFFATTCRAVLLPRFGGPEVLELCSDVEVPQLKPNQVLVRTRAVSVNPLDTRMRSGYGRSIFEPLLPLILGRDISGEVTAVGTKVHSLSVGQEVFGALHPTAVRGTYTDYAILSEDELTPKPASVTHVEASAIPFAALTAWRALKSTARITEGVLRTESPSLSHTPSALVSRNDNGKQHNRHGHSGGFNGGRGSQRPGEAVPTSDSGGIICYYCREPRHTKKTCQKLQNKNQRSQMVHTAVEASSDQGILISVDEYTHFTQYQILLPLILHRLVWISHCYSQRQRLLVVGGGGAVGFAAIQLGVAAGCHVATTCGSQSIDRVLKAGAEQAVDYIAEDVELAIKGKFDAVLDTIGVPETERIGINFLKRGGHYMTLQGEAASLTDRYGLAVGLPVATAILLKKQIQYRSSHGIGMENLCITSYFE